MNHVEVYKQSNRFATELEVRKYLRLVDRSEGIHRLKFDYDQIFDQQINSIASLEFNAVVNDWKRDLGVAFEASILQFVPEAGLIRALQ
jgi:hypothetical protein